MELPVWHLSSGTLEGNNDHSHNEDSRWVTSSTYYLQSLDVSDVAPILQLRKLELGRAK